MQAIYTLTIKEIVENLPENSTLFTGIDYPIYDEAYRAELEAKFIKHFYFREIGVETIGRFLFNLEERLNLIMPIYNKYYTSMNLEQRILNNYSLDETVSRTTGGQEKFSDTPQGQSTLVGSNYLTNLTENTGTESYTHHTEGNIGVMTDAEAVKVYQDAQRNIDLMVFNECSDLFMKIY